MLEIPAIALREHLRDIKHKFDLQSGNQVKFLKSQFLTKMNKLSFLKKK